MHSILAVDDSATMRQMVSFTLKNAGYQVTEAVDGQDAWEKADSKDFALILTDQNMPRMDGISLTKKLRAHPKFASKPILILTTESSDQMKQAGAIKNRIAKMQAASKGTNGSNGSGKKPSKSAA